jgi:protease II
MSHIISTNYIEDKTLMEEKDPQIYIETNPTKDNKFIVINSLSKNDSQISLIDLSQVDLTPTVIFQREKGVKYFVEHCEVNIPLKRILSISYQIMTIRMISLISNSIV